MKYFMIHIRIIQYQTNIHGYIYIFYQNCRNTSNSIYITEILFEILLLSLMYFEFHLELQILCIIIIH